MAARKDFPFPSLLGKKNGGRAFMVRQAHHERHIEMRKKEGIKQERGGATPISFHSVSLS
jgi:hypothetical protein